LRASVDNLPVNGPDRFSATADFMTMRSIGLTQEWTRSDKLQARAARYEREADVADAGRQLVLANLQRDTAIAWLDRLYQERMRELLARQRDEAQLQVQATEAAYRGGRGAQADVFAARLAVTQVEDRLAATGQELLTAKTRLSRWVGERGEEPLGPLPAMQAVHLHDGDLETALAQHPDVALLQRKLAVAQADARIAQENKRPDFSVELSYSQRGARYSNMVSVGITVPLQWDQKDRQDRELAAKLALVEQARAEREDEVRMHLAEAQALLQQWRSNRQRLERHQAELVPLATQRTEAALAAYGASAPLASVLDARRAEIEARMDQLKLEMETARLWAQLNYLLPSQPGTPKAPHEQNPVLSAPRALAIPLAIVIAMAAGYGLYQLGMHRGMGQLGIARRSRFFPRRTCRCCG
jgi:outer membrane protein TolC